MWWVYLKKVSHEKNQIIIMCEKMKVYHSYIFLLESPLEDETHKIICDFQFQTNPPSQV